VSVVGILDGEQRSTLGSPVAADLLAALACEFLHRLTCGSMYRPLPLSVLLRTAA